MPFKLSGYLVTRVLHKVETNIPGDPVYRKKTKYLELDTIVLSHKTTHRQVIKWLTSVKSKEDFLKETLANSGLEIEKTVFGQLDDVGLFVENVAYYFNQWTFNGVFFHHERWKGTMEHFYADYFFDNTYKVSMSQNIVKQQVFFHTEDHYNKGWAMQSRLFKSTNPAHATSMRYRQIKDLLSKESHRTKLFVSEVYLQHTTYHVTLHSGYTFKIILGLNCVYVFVPALSSEKLGKAFKITGLNVQWLIDWRPSATLNL